MEIQFHCEVFFPVNPLPGMVTKPPPQREWRSRGGSMGEHQQQWNHKSLGTRKSSATDREPFSGNP